MSDIQDYWNASSANIPNDKDFSSYAIEKETLFPAGAVVCDLGSGAGFDSLYFLQQGHSVKLVDISDLALAKAKHMFEVKNLIDKVELTQADLGDGHIPVGSGSCDVVYSRLSLHYFEPSVFAQLLSEVYRILKTDGHAYITLKSPDDENEMDYLNRQGTLKSKGVFLEDGLIKTRYDIGQLLEILSRANISDDQFTVARYTESFKDRKDHVKSGNDVMLLNEVTITKK